MKLWAGRFTKEGSKLADDFNTSLPFDIRLYNHDIKGSIAHAKMLSEVGILTEEEATTIIKELKQICLDIYNEDLKINNSEDVHMFVEAELTARIGDLGKKLHTARSRNDQVATDMRLYTVDSCINLADLIKDLINVLVDVAENNLETYMPGFTHMQKAQPITLAHHLLAYAEMFIRDKKRFTHLSESVKILPLGSCALAGTSHPINREVVKEILDFNEVSRNSMDSVSDRDFVCEFIFNCSMTMMHLSRFCEEIITWASDEYRFIEIDDSYATGSSIMPQKKNPDMAELIRGKSGRVYGDLVSILTVLKGIPLAYNKDMQEDKEGFFDAQDTLENCLCVFIEMFKTLKFNKDNLEKSAKGGFTNATDVADYLVKKGVPFRTAHEISGKLVLYAIDNNKLLEDLTLAEFNKFTFNKNIFSNDIYQAISLQEVVFSRKSKGGPSPDATSKSISEIRYLLEMEE